MALKRKRSSPTFSSPCSESATCDSSPNALPFFYVQSKPTQPLYQKPSWSFPTYESDDAREHYASSRHLNSRTMKRHRDNRPDEKSIFGAFQSSCVAWLGAADMAAFADVCLCAASTISRLYEAQRTCPKAEPVPSSLAIARPNTEEPIQRSTLHSFWHIGGAAPVATVIPMAIDMASPTAPRCDDCDGSLRHDDAMDLDDGFAEQENACASCERRVCDRCAVLGNQRICLGCASRSGT